MSAALRSRISSRKVSRVCHFTPSRNLAHILRDEDGLRGSKNLRDDVRQLFNPTDLERLDGHPDHVCCSLEYPNAWYFRKARKDQPLFLDWVVVILDIDLLLRPNVLFSPRNAAAERGRLLKPGVEGFEALYAPSVEGYGGRRYTRGPRRLAAVPTDEQAEALIPAPIPRSAIQAVAVKDRDQAATEAERLKQLNLEVPPIIVAPMFYDADALSAAMRSGQRAAETPYHASPT